MKKAIPVLIVLVNIVVYTVIVLLIKSFAYREDAYGVPMGTPITGIKVLIKSLLGLVFLIVLNVTIRKQSSNRLIKQGVLVSGGVLLCVLFGFSIWLLTR